MADETDALFERLATGDSQAARDLLPLLYDELRAIAGRQFQGQPKNHTLQPTALLHEAFFRLVGRPANGWVDRRHFFTVAATAMRQILVNHARDRAAEKRGGGSRRVLLEDGAAQAASAAGDGSQQVDVIALHEAMERLADIDARKHRVVELRFFAGLTVEEIAEVLDVSKTTVENEWRAARAWLATQLRDDEDGDAPKSE
jgi:RNA polymerase sigma-70 factor, ECF subfamily